MLASMAGLPARRGGRRFAHRRNGQDRWPYYFFKLIQKIRKLLPPWMPMIGIEAAA